jgi:hypothetical protein
VLGVGIFELGTTLEIKGLIVIGRLTNSTAGGVFGEVNFIGILAAFDPTGADGSARVSVS